jgi:hypothetical protein
MLPRSMNRARTAPLGVIAREWLRIGLLRRGVLMTLVGAGAVGVVLALAGAPVPG